MHSASVQFDRIKTFQALTSEFTFVSSSSLLPPFLLLHRLKHRVIKKFCISLLDIKIDKDLHIKMTDTDIRHFYQEFCKRVHNNYLMRVFQIFSENNSLGDYRAYVLFEDARCVIYESLSVEEQNKIKKFEGGKTEKENQEMVNHICIFKITLIHFSSVLF